MLTKKDLFKIFVVTGTSFFIVSWPITKEHADKWRLNVNNWVEKKFGDLPRKGDDAEQS